MPKKSVPTKRTVAQVETQTAVSAVKNVEPKSVVDKVSALKLALPAELDKVANEVLSFLEVRNNLRVDIDESTKRLKEIHAIEEVAVSKDELLSDIESQRAAWELEKAAVEAERSRDEEDFILSQNRSHQRRAQELQDKVEAAVRAEKLRKEILESDWMKRESELKAREDYLKDLEKQVAGMEVAIKKEVDKHVAIVGNTLKKDHITELTLLNKDRESEKKLSDATISSLNSRISNLMSDNSNLQSKLDAAQARVAEVARDAVNASSGRQALSAVQETLATQNTNDGRRK